MFFRQCFFLQCNFLYFLLLKKRTKSNLTSNTQPKFCKIFSLYFIYSIFGHSGICITSLLMFNLILPKNLNKKDEIDYELSGYNTVKWFILKSNQVFFIFVNFQLLFLLLIFNYFNKYAKNILKNYFFMIHIFFIYFYLVYNMANVNLELKKNTYLLTFVKFC